MFAANFNLEALQSVLGKGKDPVCGMEVEPSKAAGSTEYQGTTYYFCATACKETFDAEPAKYAAKK